MSKKLENATRLYLEGIRDGHAREAVTRYTGERYTQHSTGVKDGVEGFVEFFEPFVERNPVRHLELVRGLVDGPYVFLQVYQELNHGEAKWITTDLFDTDEDDKIVEHWDVIGPVSETSVSGHGQIDGPTEIEDLPATEANKKVVSAFLTEVLKGGAYDRASDFISPESYTQHNPGIADGLEGLASFVSELKAQNRSLRYEDIFKVVGQGNFVVSYSRVSMGSEELAVFDIFRLKDGRIVEHWDNMEPIPPKEEWANSGKF